MAELAVKRRANGQFAKGNNEGEKFQPGQIPNPNGRHGSLADLFRALSEAKKGDKSRKEKIVDTIIQLAERGNLKAAEMYFNRIEGKPKEFRETTVKTEPIKVFEFDD